MKIRVEEIRNLTEPEIVVRYPEKNEHVDRILATLKALDEPLILKQGDQQIALSPTEIYYFESVDNKVCACSATEVFETNSKLYELEETLSNYGFQRINKTTVVNTKKIRSFQSELNGRMRATLKNGEIVMVSRTYVASLKYLLGGKKR